MTQIHTETKETKRPTVSVLMSVYNEEAYIKEAIESILAQTITDFELLIYHDCSTDDTLQYLKSVTDPRVRLIENIVNCGQTKNLNKALSQAKGKYIAVMDADDVSKPDRFAKEIAYLEANPEVFLVSCEYEIIGEHKEKERFPSSPEAVRVMLLVRSVLRHSGFMMRREVITQGKMQYNDHFRYEQDYDFSARVSRKYRIAVVPQCLIQYRVHDQQVSRINRDEQRMYADEVRDNLLSELGIFLSPEENECYGKFSLQEGPVTKDEYIATYEILRQLIEANDLQGVYTKDVFRNTLCNMLYVWMIRNGDLNLIGSLKTIAPDGGLHPLSMICMAFGYWFAKKTA